MRLPVRRAMDVCPIEVAVSVLGGTWKLTLVKHMGEGSRRFNELGRLVPLANTKTLTRQLRELEEDGIVRRTVYQEVPPKVEYSLTELGRTLEPLVAEMDSWGALFSAQLSGDTTRDADGARATSDRRGSEAPAEGSASGASVG